MEILKSCDIMSAVVCGEVAEWSKAGAWRASEPRGSVGSNPSFSAIKYGLILETEEKNGIHAVRHKRTAPKVLQTGVPFIERRGNIYYFRWVIPKTERFLWNKSEIRLSLKTPYLKLARRRGEFLHAFIMIFPMNLSPEERVERVKWLHEEALLLTDKHNPSWEDSVESVALARDHSLHLTPDEEIEKEVINEVYGDTKQKNDFIELFEGKRRIVPVTSEKSPETDFSQREIDLTVELLIANDWTFLEKKLLASDHRVVEGDNLGISLDVEDLTLYLLVRKKNLRNILKARAFTDLYTVRKLIPHTNRHFPEIAQKFVSGALANCDRALMELNGILPPESVQIAYRSEHPIATAALPVSSAPLPAEGPDYKDPEIATVVEEIIAEKTTSKARKEVSWTEKTRVEFESKFKFILRYFGEGRKVSEITRDDLTNLMDIFNTRLSARQGQKMEDLDPHELLSGKIPVGKIANATVEKWTTALNMILKRVHDFYPGALKVSYSIVKKEVVLPDKEQKIVRLTYSPDDLQKLFGQNFAADSLKGGKPLGTGVYFLFGALTGARAEELGQICRDDIITVDDILCLQIDGDAELGTRVKNKASKRTIPVPEPLVRIIQFLMTNKKKKENLWGFTKSQGKKASFSRNAARWWNTYVRKKLGKADAVQALPNGQTGVKVFHSFRHTIASVGKSIGIEQGYTSEILGHDPSDAMKNTTTHYESKFAPSELAPKLKAINEALGVDWEAVADRVLVEMTKRKKIS
jgi:integrase